MTIAARTRQSLPFERIARRVVQVAALLVFVYPGSASHAEAQTSSLANYTFTAGWATFGLALPPGAAATGVQVAGLPTQTDVKVRWSDGTIRFAIVSANIPAA